jgi:RimJ/RimL family protein N-acetyltransferase
MDLTPVTLRGRFITLEPLGPKHADGLFPAMQDEEVCCYLAWPPPTHPDETRALIRDAEEQMGRRQSIVFAQIWNETGPAIGSTRLLDVRPADARWRSARRSSPTRPGGLGSAPCARGRCAGT